MREYDADAPDVEDVIDRAIRKEKKKLAKRGVDPNSVDAAVDDVVDDDDDAKQAANEEGDDNDDGSEWDSDELAAQLAVDKAALARIRQKLEVCADAV